jgi:hypothetical protein
VTRSRGRRHDGEVKRQTAVRHLDEVGELATDRLRLRGSGLAWAVEELWVAGELLTDAVSVEVAAIIMKLDLAPDQLPWLALHADAEWYGHELRLPKRPLGWCYRPLAWPAWSAEHRRVIRFWTAAAGTDRDALEALSSPTAGAEHVIEPSSAQLAAQLGTELPVSREHLRTTLDRYWDREWRRRHHTQDAGPEDHLWRAAAAVQELEDVLALLEPHRTPDVNGR